MCSVYHESRALSSVFNGFRGFQQALNIGNIKDIACAIKIDDFLKLKLPPRIKLRWPISEIKENPSSFDMLVNYTHEQMKSYTSHAVRPMVEIW